MSPVMNDDAKACTIWLESTTFLILWKSLQGNMQSAILSFDKHVDLYFSMQD